MIAHKAYECDSNTEVLLVADNGNKMVASCTAEQYTAGLLAYKKGDLMQHAFDFLSPDVREFLISGLTPAQFRSLFPKEE